MICPGGTSEGCLKERVWCQEWAELGTEEVALLLPKSSRGQNARAMIRNLLPSPGTQSQKNSRKNGISQVKREKIIMFWEILFVPFYFVSGKVPHSLYAIKKERKYGPRCNTTLSDHLDLFNTYWKSSFGFRDYRLISFLCSPKKRKRGKLFDLKLLHI